MQAATPVHATPIDPESISRNDTGFEAIFDGKSLQGWDGDPRYWRVENRALVGETTEENGPEGHYTFIIWREGKLEDFELKLEYRISSKGNSGVEYRSTIEPEDQWKIRGYQATLPGMEWGKWLEKSGLARGRDFNGQRAPGLNFDHLGRGVLALPGQLSYVGDGAKRRVLASVGDPESLIHVVDDNWNSLHLIVRDKLMIHIVNGRVMSIVIDDESVNRPKGGVLGLKVADLPPMKVEFRNIRVKTF